MKRFFAFLLPSFGRLLLLSLAFAQTSKQISINGQFLNLINIENTNYIEAFALSRALNLDIRASKENIVLLQGGKIIEFSYKNEKIRINGEEILDGKAVQNDSGIFLPVEAVAKSINAEIKESSLVLSPVKLTNVPNTQFAQSDRVILELSRDANFTSKFINNRLTISFTNASADNTTFKVGGRFISEVKVSQTNENAEAVINLPNGVGFRAFPLPALGAQPARVVIDVGPDFQRSETTLPTVVIDPGHGGLDHGQTAGGLVAKDVTLEMAKRIAAQLRDANVRVVLTREDDRDLDFDSRIEFSYQADVFISLDLAQLNGSDASGVAIYTKPAIKESNKLAQKMNERLLTLPFKSFNRNADVKILDEAPSAALMIELGWLSNKNDRQRLLNPAHLSEFSAAIAKGITDYLENK